MIKRLAFIWVPLISAPLMAFNTYFFKVPVDSGFTKIIAASNFDTRGKKGDSQPFFNTHIYTLPVDTSCILVQITPKDDAEFSEVKTMFGIPGVELWKEFRITDAGVEPLVDNSEKVTINTDWTVAKSSK